MSQSQQSESEIRSNSINEKSIKTLHQRGDGFIDIPSSSNSSTDEEDASLTICEPLKNNRSSYDKLDTRNKAERLLYHFVQEVNIEGIREVIKRYPEDYFINAKNRNGHDLLTFSVKSGDLEVLRVVLWEIDPGRIETSRGLSMAVRLNKMDFLLEILSFEDKRNNPKEDDDQNDDSDGESQKVQYTKHCGDSGNELTPLMVAVLEKHFEMIEVLYERGEQMPILHFPSCTCKICKSCWESGDHAKDPKRIRRRIKLLEAMGSAEWLIFMSGQDGSWDPIREVMLVKEKIDRCIKEEAEWTKEYEMVLRNVVEFPRIMITLCLDIKEVKLLLGGNESSRPYPVVRQALNGAMKDFVAEPSVQFLVYQEFYGGEYGWRPKTRVESFAKILLIVLIMVGFPLFSLVLWVKNLGGGEIRDYREPLSRFLASAESRYWMRLASFLLFLGILVLVNVNQVGVYDNDKQTHKIIFGLRGAVVLYVASHGINLLKGFWGNPQSFFKSPFNKMELVSCSFFCKTFATWLCENMMDWAASKHEENYDSYLFDQWLMVLHCIGQGSFAFGVTLSVLQIFRYTLLFSSIGRLQASFAKMVEGKWKTVLFHIIFMLVSLTLASWAITGKSQFWKFRPYVWVLMLLSWISFLSFLFLKVILTGLCWTGLKCGSKGEEDDDTEYKYQITMELMRYLEDKGLAPPFNLIPCFGVGGGGPASKSKIDAAEERKKEYPYLLRKLFLRYFQKVG